MSRWSGPARRGARKVMLDLKRTEAETRQAAERARDDERAAAYVEPPELTGAELLGLLYAVMRQDALRAYEEHSGVLRGSNAR